MAKLIYSAIASLDGYTADEKGNFEWAAPSDEVHAFVNDLERPIGTYLYGRRMYEVMRFWETVPASPEHAITNDFTQIWQAAEKVVFSKTLDAVSSRRTRLERDFDPDAIRALKARSDRDLGVGGADLAAQAIRAGLVDEYQLFFVPILVGGGTAALPSGALVSLDLIDIHRFENGTVYLDYRAAG
jgi:dihydrofolate reductase